MAGSSIGLAHVVAHQGGWDEIALVAGPIVLVIALLAVVKRRVDNVAANAPDPPPPPPPSATDDTDRVQEGR
jgi:hypothetical protein